MSAPGSQAPSHWHRHGGKSGSSPIETSPRHPPQTGGNTGRVGFLAAFVLGPGLVSFLPAGVPCVPAWGGWGWGMSPPPLPLSLAVGVSPSDFQMHTRPRAPGFAQAQGEHAWAPPSSPPPCALRLCPPCSSCTGPVATGSRRRRLVLRLSQKDALQALFQRNPYPGIATRERLARELGIAESRVQVGPRLCPRSPFQALHADPSRLKAPGGLSPQKEFSLFAPRSGSKTNAEDGQSRADRRRLNMCTKKGKRGRRPRPRHRRARLDLSLPLQVT